jgi:hypothetical protein
MLVTSARYNQTPLFLGSVSAAATLDVAVPVPASGTALPLAPAAVLVVLGFAAVSSAARRRWADPGADHSSS